MSTPLRSLLWKEWHEQRWKVIFACVILSAYTAIGLRTRLLPDEQTLMVGTFIAGLLLPILASMDLIAAERSEGSLACLLSMPVPPWLPFAVKTAMGVLTCILPFCWAMAIAILVAGEREIPVSRIALICQGGIGFGLSLFLWTHCLSVRQPSEARAALVGIAVIAGMCVLTFVLTSTGVRILEQLCLMVTPVVFFAVTLSREPEVLPHAAWMHGLVAVGLLWWASRQFARFGRPRE